MIVNGVCSHCGQAEGRHLRVCPDYDVPEVNQQAAEEQAGQAV